MLLLSFLSKYGFVDIDVMRYLDDFFSLKASEELFISCLPYFRDKYFINLTLFMLFDALLADSGKKKENQWYMHHNLGFEHIPIEIRVTKKNDSEYSSIRVYEYYFLDRKLVIHIADGMSGFIIVKRCYIKRRKEFFIKFEYVLRPCF